MRTASLLCVLAVATGCDTVCKYAASPGPAAERLAKAERRAADLDAECGMRAVAARADLDICLSDANKRFETVYFTPGIHYRDVEIALKNKELDISACRLSAK